MMGLGKHHCEIDDECYYCVEKEEEEEVLLVSLVSLVVSLYAIVIFDIII